jgi:hypothetical protein
MIRRSYVVRSIRAIDYFAKLVALSAVLIENSIFSRDVWQGLDRGEDAITSLLAVAAGFGAHPAMLVVLSMLLALVPADAACPSAGLKSGTCHLCVESRLAGQYLASGFAHLGAVEAKPYAAGQHLYVILAKAGVGAGGAGLGTVEASLDTLYQRGLVHGGLGGVGLDHLLDVSHGTFLPLACATMGVPPHRRSKTLASKLVDELPLFTENPRATIPGNRASGK